MGVSGDGVDPDRGRHHAPQESDRALLTTLLGGAGQLHPARSAERLLASWASLPAVLAAAPERIDQIGGAGAGRMLAAVRDILARVARREIEDRPLLGSTAEVSAYLRTVIAHSAREEAHVLYLDAANHLLRDERVASGTVNRVEIFPREIVRRSLELGASALILVHNHPSGDPSPTVDDVRITKRLADLCGGFDIRVHDHIIIARSGYASLRAMGLIQSSS